MGGVGVLGPGEVEVVLAALVLLQLPAAGLQFLYELGAMLVVLAGLPELREFCFQLVTNGF